MRAAWTSIAALWWLWINRKVIIKKTTIFLLCLSPERENYPLGLPNCYFQCPSSSWDPTERWTLSSRTSKSHLLFLQPEINAPSLYFNINSIFTSFFSRSLSFTPCLLVSQYWIKISVDIFLNHCQRRSPHVIRPWYQHILREKLYFVKIAHSWEKGGLCDWPLLSTGLHKVLDVILLDKIAVSTTIRLWNHGTMSINKIPQVVYFLLVALYMYVYILAIFLQGKEKSRDGW